jgi:hypothetical protein
MGDCLGVSARNAGDGTMNGTIGILNVGAGDTKLSFDPSNPAECIRAARIVKDMLRRGYALLVQVQKDDKLVYERVRDFREDTCEYIIADFDPIEAQKVDEQPEADAAEDEAATGEQPAAAPKPVPKPRGGRPEGTRRIPASSTRGIAVSRTAGG